MFLLDTNVVSELRRPGASLNVSRWVDSQPREAQFLSAISLTEVNRGATRHPDEVQRAAIQRWIDSSLHIWFENRILPVTFDMAESAGISMGIRERNGRPFSLPDALIAATAIKHSFVLVTRNTKDFVGLPLDLYNPWTDTLSLAGNPS